MDDAARFGLRLTLGGAPNAAHHVVGLPGTYHPTEPTPLASVGLSLEAARRAADDPGCPVELVELTQAAVPVETAPPVFDPAVIPGGDTTDPED